MSLQLFLNLLQVKSSEIIAMQCTFSEYFLRYLDTENSHPRIRLWYMWAHLVNEFAFWEVQNNWWAISVWIRKKHSTRILLYNLMERKKQISTKCRFFYIKLLPCNAHSARHFGDINQGFYSTTFSEMVTFQILMEFSFLAFTLSLSFQKSVNTEYLKLYMKIFIPLYI